MMGGDGDGEMGDTALDLTPFANAIGQLRQSIDYARAAFAREDRPLAQLLRTAVVQAFEFTFELSVKLIKRYLELAESAGSEVRIYSFNRLLRLAYEKEVTRGELSLWREFRDLRNISAHTYDEDKAEKVYRAAPRLLAEAEDLLLVLRRLAPDLA